MQVDPNRYLGQGDLSIGGRFLAISQWVTDQLGASGGGVGRLTGLRPSHHRLLPIAREVAGNRATSLVTAVKGGPDDPVFEGEEALFSIGAG